MARGHVCFGCKLPIFDTYLMSISDHWWHESCAKCEECQAILREKCYFVDSRLLCKTDYERLYLVRCSGCQQLITPEQYVRKQGNKTFHLSCLKCNLCEREASTGEHIFITSDNLYLCRRDYEQSKQIRKTEKEEKIVENDSEGDDKSPGGISVNGEVLNSDEDDDLNKRRGPRTTIKAKQLEVLKSAFIATPKPSRHIREKLAHDTGLSMRVIQVWFQNRRSKERRVKQLSVHDTRRNMRRPKIENSSNGITDMDFRYYQNNNAGNMMHHGYNKIDTSQYPEYITAQSQTNPLQYQSLVHDDLMLGNEFLNDPNNNDISLMNSFNQTDIPRNGINENLLTTYETL